LIRAAVGTAIIVAVASFAAWWQSQLTTADDVGNWYGVAPPLIAIIFAFVTRRVVISLGVAVVLGGLLVHVPGNAGALDSWASGIYAGPVFVFDAFTATSNLQILIFVPIIFGMVLIITEAGGFDGLLVYVSKLVKGRKSAQLATATSGVLYFFDDYSNAMVVGSAMRPLTDRHRISREKLAFIVDSTSAPMASLALISTWIMYEVGLFNDSAESMGISNSGYSIFLDVLQYRFYCIFILILVFLHIIIGRDFGSMKSAESNALNSNPDESKTNTKNGEPGSVWIAVIPLTGLILFHFTGMWHDGGGLEKLREGASFFQWSYWRDVIGNAENVVLIFDYAATFGLVLAILTVSFLSTFSRSDIGGCIWRGLRMSIIPCSILIFAWSLKNCSDALHTDRFLVALLTENVSLILLPMLVFLVGCVTSFTTGTSWGTMAILIPIVGPVAFQLEGGVYGLITMMSLGAVLDGAIFGDHCSPISDTTIISASATQCDLIQHVRTQMPYSILGATVALFCGYLSMALGSIWTLSLGFGILVIAATFFLFGKNAEKATS